jgi:MFS family permease
MAVLYSFTAELFPTETRGVTVGISSTLGHFGGVVAPILADAVDNNNLNNPRFFARKSSFIHY